jgi:hypothetical protein
VVLLVVSQSLDVSAVKTTSSRVPTNREVREVALQPTLNDFDAPETAVLEVLRARFRKIAAREGLTAFQPAPATAEPSVRPADFIAPAPRDVIAVMRVVKGEETEWELMSNEVKFARVGLGCCAPCPCTNGVCAPCAVCQDRAPCAGVTTGLQVTVRFLVRGKKLVKESVLVEPVNSSLPLGQARQQKVTLLRSEGDEKLAAFVRSRRAAFEGCARKSSKTGAVTLSFNRVGQKLEQVKATASALEPLATECLLTVLRGSKVPTGEGVGTVQLEFGFANED